MSDLIRGLGSLVVAGASAAVAGFRNRVADSALGTALAVAAAVTALAIAGEKLGAAADTFGVRRRVRGRNGRKVEWTKVGAAAGAVLGLLLALVVVVSGGLSL